MNAYVNKKRPKPCMRWSCDLVQTAGKFLSVLTTVHPEKAGWLLPIGVHIVYRINIYVSMIFLGLLAQSSIVPFYQS